MASAVRNKKSDCPLVLTLEMICGKWKGIIIWFLLENPVLRFSNLKAKINEATKITDKMLIQCLRGLEEDGLVERKIYPIVPPKVEYSLTEMGKKLRPLFLEIVKFGHDYQE